MILPDFIIAGERRSGSTSLGKWMEAHPELFMYPRMDLNYFLETYLTIIRRTWKNGEFDPEEWEKDHSLEAYASLFEAGKGKKAIGEKSPDLLYWQPSHARMKAFVPEAKIILTLRHPIKRAWSMYWNEVGKARERLSFEDAIVQEEERCKGGAYMRDHFSYFRRGFYDETISEFYKTFPPEQVLIIILEESIADPIANLRKIYQFIGVNPELGMERAHIHYNNNWTSVPHEFWRQNAFLSKVEAGFVKYLRNGMGLFVHDSFERRRIMPKIEGVFRKTMNEFKMEEDTRKYLEDLYRPHVNNFENLIGRKIEAWKF
jgi:hypothetical protein